MLLSLAFPSDTGPVIIRVPVGLCVSPSAIYHHMGFKPWQNELELDWDSLLFLAIYYILI